MQPLHWNARHECYVQVMHDHDKGEVILGIYWLIPAVRIPAAEVLKPTRREVADSSATTLCVSSSCTVQAVFPAISAYFICEIVRHGHSRRLYCNLVCVCEGATGAGGRGVC